jgi:hypothetical protein
VLLILSSLFIFLFGLISEQIAALRFESSQRPYARKEFETDWSPGGDPGQGPDAST